MANLKGDIAELRAELAGEISALRKTNGMLIMSLNSMEIDLATVPADGALNRESLCSP